MLEKFLNAYWNAPPKFVIPAWILLWLSCSYGLVLLVDSGARTACESSWKNSGLEYRYEHLQCYVKIRENWYPSSVVRVNN